MAITMDSQFEIRGVTFGRGENDLWLEKQRFEGLLDLGEPLSSDTPLWGQAGSVGQPEYEDVKVITIHAKIVSNSQASCLSALATFRSAWAVSPIDIPLTCRLGGTTFQVMGRPRGAKVDQSKFDTAQLLLFPRFDALVPTLTVV